jgi:hypothetical protein
MPFVYKETENVREWKPNQKQAQFLSVPDNVLEALYGGAAGGGKTEILLVLPILRQWFDRPNFKGIIFRRSYPQLEESIIPRSRELYKPIGGVYNEGKHFWTFPSGAQFFLGYMLRDENARDHDTAEYNYVGFDELTHFSQFMYQYIVFSRIRGDIAVARGATNPGNMGHAWVRDRFVLPCVSGGKLLRDRKTNQLRIYIHAKVTDNEWLMKADPEYVNRLLGLPEAERKAKLEGDWFSFSGQVFQEYRDVKRDNEPPNALHVVEPFIIPSYWPRVAAIDWGHSAYTWMGWAAISPDKRAFLYREYHEKGKYVSEWASTFKLYSDLDKIKRVVLDPSAKQKHGDPASILQQFSDESGYVPDMADNDRISGKMLLHEYFRWSERPRTYIPAEGYQEDVAQQIFRMSGGSAYEKYKNLFLPQAPEKNLPKLQVFKNCPIFSQAILLAHYNEDGKGNPEDVAEWNPTDSSPGDDPYDGGRYLIKLVDRFISDPNYEAITNTAVDNAIKDYAHSGDTTSFYRKMEHIERVAKELGPKPIPIYHNQKSIRASMSKLRSKGTYNPNTRTFTGRGKTRIG